MYKKIDHHYWWSEWRRGELNPRVEKGIYKHLHG